MNEIKKAAEKLAATLKAKGDIAQDHSGVISINLYNGSVCTNIKIEKTVKTD